MTEMKPCAFCKWSPIGGCTPREEEMSADNRCPNWEQRMDSPPWLPSLIVRELARRARRTEAHK